MIQLTRLSAALLSLMIMTTSSWSGALDSVPFPKKLKLAKVGDEDAQVAVAIAYETGKGAKQDVAAAVVWYRKAVDQGNVEAEYRLARIMQDGAQGVKKNPTMAAKLYGAAAENGYPDAQNGIGYCYQHGIGVEKDAAKAMDWYQRAADNGVAAAQNSLGLMYLNGEGVARDYAHARKLFEQAASQNYDWALNNLGGLYEMGWGVTADRQKAVDFYKKAQAKGNENATANLKRLNAALDTGTVSKPAEADQASPDETPQEAQPKTDGSDESEAVATAPAPVVPKTDSSDD